MTEIESMSRTPFVRRRRSRFMNAFIFAVSVQPLPSIVGFPRILTDWPHSIVASTVLLLWVTTTGYAVLAFYSYRSAVRVRTIGDHQYYSVLFGAIRSVLKGRGVLNATNYIRKHPAHATALESLIERLCDWYDSDMDVASVSSLVFLYDEHPERTAHALLTIVSSGRSYRPEDVRDALDSFKDVPTPLSDGAL